MESSRICNNTNDDRLIKYDTLASLEYLARAKCALNLIDYNEVRKLLAVRRTNNQNDRENVLARHLKGKIFKLRLPGSICEKLIRTSYRVSNELEGWIKYHDEEIFNVTSEVHPIAFRYLESIVWTSLGTIDYFSTAENLIGKNFGDDIKFRIAYAYGLYNFMAELSHKLMKNSNYLKKTFAKHERDLLQRSPIYYWICYIHADRSEVENVYGYGTRSYVRIEMFFFNVFVQMPNYVLIKYIWNKLTTAEKIDRILDLVTTNVSSDLQLYFLSQLSAQDQRSVIHSRVPYIYKMLVNDNYVRSFYDNLIEYIWNVMTYKDFIQIIEFLFESINDTEHVARNKCKQIFKDLWSSASIPLRYQALEHDYDRCLRIRLQNNRRYRNNLADQKKSTLLPWKWANNEDIIEMVLLDATPLQRKRYLKTNSSIAYGIQMIKKGKYARLQLFIEKFLPDHEDLLEYKSDIIRGENYDLIKHFYEQDHPTGHHFYHWCFESKRRMNEFLLERRQSMWTALNDFFIAEKNIRKVESFLEWMLLSLPERAEWLEKFQLEAWLKLINSNPKITLIEIEYFLDWSFKTSSKLFKSKFIIPSYTALLAKYICVLIKENKARLLGELLNWCFLYNQQKIRRFKIDFLEKCRIDDFVDVVASTVIAKNDLRYFNHFFGAWFANEMDFRIFTMKMASPRIASWIAAEFVSRSKFKMADAFFKSCFRFNDSQMAKFRLRIIADECMRDVVQGKDTKFINNFIRWADPPAEQRIEIFFDLFTFLTE